MSQTSKGCGFRDPDFQHPNKQGKHSLLTRSIGTKAIGALCTKCSTTDGRTPLKFKGSHAFIPVDSRPGESQGTEGRKKRGEGSRKTVGGQMWWDRQRCCDTAHHFWAAGPAQGRGFQDGGMFLPLSLLPKQHNTVDVNFSPKVSGTESAA